MVADRDTAARLARDPAVTVRLLSYGEGRAKAGYMAQATKPAALQALAGAGLELADISSFKTHNPFAANDLYLAAELDLDLQAMNDFGCPLLLGHPQAPTGARLVMELVEELVLKGGGRGLFVGCAAGDTGASLIVEVELD